MPAARDRQDRGRRPAWRPHGSAGTDCGVNILEIAVYAAVLAGGAPVLCHLEEDGSVGCSNGRVAQNLSVVAIRFDDGVTVARGGTALPEFNNGVQSWKGSSGWLQFSTGVGVRGLDRGTVSFSNGLVCRAELPDLVNCDRKRPPFTKG